MFKRGVIAVVVAALLAVQLPSAVLANDNGGGGSERNQQRDTQSRNEQNALQALPLLLANDAQMRVIMMIFMMQRITYQLFMAPGVNVTSQNRVGLGGLFGGVFSKTYSADDFLKSLEVGSVYRDGTDKVAIALKGDLRLEDYRVIVFNGENQFDVTGRPQVQQIDPQVLAQLGALSIIVQLLGNTLVPVAFKEVAEMQADGTIAADLTPQDQTDLLLLRKLLVGKVYLGANNTLLILIPPAIVLNR
jgi:hypothetical protein